MRYQTITTLNKETERNKSKKYECLSIVIEFKNINTLSIILNPNIEKKIVHQSRPPFLPRDCPFRGNHSVLPDEVYLQNGRQCCFPHSFVIYQNLSPFT